MYTDKMGKPLIINDNGISVARDGKTSNTEQKSIGDSAITVWETEGEEGTDSSPKPEVITTLFERKAPGRPSNLQSLFIMSLLQSNEKGQEFDNSPSVIRRSMIAEEDQNSCHGTIRQDMVQERKQNANPYLQQSIQHDTNDQGSKLNSNPLTAVVLTIYR